MNARKILEKCHPQRNKSISTKINVSVLFLHINTFLWQSWESIRAWGPVESGCSHRQLSYQVSIFRSSLIVKSVWLPPGHDRAQPPPSLTWDMPCLRPLKVVLHRQNSNVKGKVRYQKLIRNSAGAWRGPLHFCWEENIPTKAVCREFVREDRNERRGRKLLNAEEMSEWTKSVITLTK